MSSSIFNSDWLWGLLPAAAREALQRYAHLGTLDLDRVLLQGAWMIALLCAGFWIKRRQGGWRLPLYVIVGILLGRALLFGNPLAWLFYQQTLSEGSVGHRQYSQVVAEVRRYFVPPPELEYLALGSSQTGAVYAEYAKSHPDFFKIEFAGLGPTEYFLYRGLIERYQPRHVLLYLSEFDFGRPPPYEAFKYAPCQGPGFFSYAALLRELDPQHAGDGIEQLLLGAFSPEWRYSFIHKGLLAHWTGAGQSSSEAPAPNAGLPASSLWDLSVDHLAISKAGLRHFLEWCEAREVSVILVQGQYAPSNRKAENEKMGLRVLGDLLDLAREFECTSFVSKDVFRPLTEEDYRDGAHVTYKTGYEMATSLVQYLEQASEKP